MCTKPLPDGADDEIDELDRQYRTFRIFLSIFGFLAVCLLIAGLSTDWWVTYHPVDDVMEEDNVTMDANTGIWRSCVFFNSTVPDFFAGLIMVCGGTVLVILADILLVFHIRFITKCLLMTASIIFFLSGVAVMIACMFLWFSFSFAIPWYSEGRELLIDYQPSINWSFLLTTVGAIYSTVYGLFLGLAMKCVKNNFLE